jgi:thymidine phosphorylase
MSKKIASGTRNLVLDVKYGVGAFMKDRESAAELASMMVAIGSKHGINMAFRLSSMNDVLGSAVGNAIEISECLNIMNGSKDPLLEELRKLSIALAADLVGMLEKDKSRETIESELALTLENGSAKKAFMCLLAAQGCDLSEGVPIDESPFAIDVSAPGSGTVSYVDVERIGLIAAFLGSNRIKSSDPIFHDVGIEVLCHLGDTVELGQPIARIRYGEKSRKRLQKHDFAEATASLVKCYSIS